VEQCPAVNFKNDIILITNHILNIRSVINFVLNITIHHLLYLSCHSCKQYIGEAIIQYLVCYIFGPRQFKMKNNFTCHIVNINDNELTAIVLINILNFE
jgi:hypothetical protein